MEESLATQPNLWDHRFDHLELSGTQDSVDSELYPRLIFTVQCKTYKPFFIILRNITSWYNSSVVQFYLRYIDGTTAFVVELDLGLDPSAILNHSSFIG
jgi:hypothetical protein